MKSENIEEKSYNDKVFLKTKSDGLWESNPHIAFAIYMFGGIFIFFIFLMLGHTLIGLLFSILLSVILPVKKNNEDNISKSIAFIKRNNKWYAIKLMYSYADSGVIVHAPAGSFLQAATLPHNIDVAFNIQNQEKQIRKLREIEEIYSLTLDGVLKTLEEKKYSKPIYEKADKKIDYLLNKYYFNEIFIDNNQLCGYIILNNLKLVKVSNKFITFSFNDENGNKKNMKFRNAYKGLIEEITKENS